ncbi:MAG: carboxymuconolactone decarboxylase family protein [Maricaulaceae bacterium]|jgi:alkylhydroperoxidase family enzyme
MSETPDEPGLAPLPVEQWDASLGPVLNDMRGRPLNIHALMANHPLLLKSWWSLREYIVRGGDLEQRECELVILRVAAHLKSWYEWAAHVERGLKAGLELEEIDRVKGGSEAEGWSAKDRALLEAVEACMAHQRIGPTTLDTVRSHFTNKQVLDIIVIQGLYMTIGSMLKTWGVQLDEFVELPEGYERDPAFD